mmetsp:Transcript_27242/g.65758  ORF Transcript_27242/g.65758 Transcript_27242/m.65758 type:complete len:236 (-) Transcript_27242:101-808(-)
MGVKGEMWTPEAFQARSRLKTHDLHSLRGLKPATPFSAALNLRRLPLESHWRNATPERLGSSPRLSSTICVGSRQHFKWESPMVSRPGTALLPPEGEPLQEPHESHYMPVRLPLPPTPVRHQSSRPTSALPPRKKTIPRVASAPAVRIMSAEGRRISPPEAARAASRGGRYAGEDPPLDLQSTGDRVVDHCLRSLERSWPGRRTRRVRQARSATVEMPAKIAATLDISCSSIRVQ